MFDEMMGFEGDATRETYKNLSCWLGDQDLKKLTKIPGIGQWTATMYMLSAMERIDIWPSTDLGLINGSKDLIESRITDQSLVLGMRWSPLRSIAASLIWHYYSKKFNSY